MPLRVRLARLLGRHRPPSAAPPSPPQPRPALAAPSTARPPGPLPPAPADTPDPRDPPDLVVRVGLDALLAGLRPRGAPLLVYHWASWDAPSTDGLVAVGVLAARGLAVVGVAWDEFVAPPMTRIAPMATRPAKWSGGEQAAAWMRRHALDWPTLVYADPPDTLFDGLGLAERYVPQVTLYGPDGSVLAHHGGPLVGAGWVAFVDGALGPA